MKTPRPKWIGFKTIQGKMVDLYRTQDNKILFFSTLSGNQVYFSSKKAQKLGNDK